MKIALEWLHEGRSGAASRIVMATGMLHGICVGGAAGARNTVFFQDKWLQPEMKGSSSVMRLRLGSL